MDLKNRFNQILFGKIAQDIFTQRSAVDMDKILGDSREKKERQLKEVIERYRGSAPMLKDLLERFGTYNPWEAASRMVLESAELISIEGAYETHKRRALSDSGHWVTNTMYKFVHGSDPAIRWQTASTNAIKFTQEFGTPQQKALITDGKENQATRKKQRLSRKAEKEYVQTLEEVLEDPSVLAYVKSTIDKQKLFHIQGLDSQIKDMTSYLETVRFSQPEYLLPRSHRQLMALEPGGQLYGWLKRKIIESPEKVPKIVKDAYINIQDTIVDLKDDNWRKWFGTIMWYRELELPISKEAAIGSYLKDYRWLDSLPEDHEIFRRFGELDVTSVYHIIDQKGDITAFEASKFISIYPFREIRTEQNQTLLSRWESDLSFLEERISSLFLEDGKWQMDCIESIPHRITKESGYGKYLARKDLTYVRDLLKLKTLSMDSDRMLGSVAIKDFEDLVKHAAIVSRRIRYNEKTGSPLPKSKRYGLIEDFKDSFRISPEQFQKRLFSRYANTRYWESFAQKFKEDADAGLYLKDTKKDNPIENILPAILRLKPRSEYQEKYSKAKDLVDKDKNPLLVYSYALLPKMDNDYLMEHEAKSIDDVLEVEAYIDQHLSYDKIKDLKRQLGIIKSSEFYDGTIDDSVIITAGNKSPQCEVQVGSVTLIDPKRLISEIDAIKKDYRQLADLPSGWIRKLRFLDSHAGFVLLGRIGKSLGTDTLQTIRHPSPDGFYSDSLISSIDGLYEEMEHQVTYNPSVILKASRPLLTDGFLDDNYHVIVKNTNKQRDGGGTFRSVFPEFRYNMNKRCWDSSLTKIEVADVTKRIRDYNKDRNANIYIILEKQ